MMKDYFVPYNIAVKLKEKGFKEKCVAHYFNDAFDYNICQFRGVNIEDLLYSFNALSETNDLYDSYKNYVDAPTISQVLKWLREEAASFSVPVL